MTTFSLSRTDFPESFLFGTSTSAYQIEGHKFGGAGSTHWDSFAATPGNVVRQENGSLACDHYNRYREDLKLAADAGFDAYRFSTSWARIMPEGKGQINNEGLDFYDRLVDTICSFGMKPFLTLYHWELPSALADLGGWVNRDIARWFGDFAAVVTERLGDRLYSVAPINEPWCVAWLSHYLGAHAPGMHDIRSAARAMHHVCLGHGLAVEAIRTHCNKAEVGAVINFEYAEPADTKESSLEAAKIFAAIHRWFLEGMVKGSYPEEILTYLQPHMPAGWQDDMQSIARPLDWIGINYYTRKLLTADPARPFPSVLEIPGPLPKTTMEWEIYPEGLGYFLRLVHQVTEGNLPIYITENGMAASDVVVNGKVLDDARIDYLDQHFQQALQAIREGIDLRGYFIWSLLDNFEWALGYEKRFGLIHVDFETLKRTPKQSLHSLQQFLK